MANDRDMSGALFRETDKKSDRSPDYTGNLKIGGIKYRLAGWVRDGRDGKKFLSIAASLPDEPKAEDPDQAKRDWQKPAEPEIPF